MNNVKQITESLRDHGKACIELSNRLNTVGKPLNQQDMDLIRVGLLSEVKAACQDIQYSFLMDDAMTYDKASDIISGFFRFFKFDKGLKA